MDVASAILLVGAIAEGAVQGAEIWQEWTVLARRVRDGETITDEEIQTAFSNADKAESRWEEAGEHDRQD